jgi:hypothetical protein
VYHSLAGHNAMEKTDCIPRSFTLCAHLSTWLTVRARSQRPYSLDLDRMKVVLRANYLINPAPTPDKWRTQKTTMRRLQPTPIQVFLDTYRSPIFNDEEILHTLSVERRRPGSVSMDGWPRGRYDEWQGLFPYKLPINTENFF